MSKVKDILARLDSLEARLDAHNKAQDKDRGPEDLFGKYYDTLDDADKWRWWEYLYCNHMPFKTLEQYEEYELKHTVESLHFQCFNIPALMDFTALDDLMIEMDRRDYLGGH